MKRPLFWACVCIIIIYGLFFSRKDFTEREKKSFQTLSEQCIYVTGRVVKKEKVIYNQQSTWRIYLTSPYMSFVNPDQFGQSTQAIQTEINEQLHSKKIIWETTEDSIPAMEERIWIRGTFRLYSDAGNPGMFNAYEYYRSHNICGKLVKAERIYPKEVAPEKASWLKESIWKIKECLCERLWERYPEEEASILMKMLLGEGSSLDQEIKNLYKDGGILHILAISGLHITLLGMAVYYFFRKIGIPIPLCALIGVLFLLFYGILTGWSLSAIRAIGMYIIKVMGEVIRKDYDMLTAMALLAVFLLMVNPNILYQSGYWLSFGAVFAMGTAVPLLVEQKRLPVRGTGWQIGKIRIPEILQEKITALIYKAREMFLSGIGIALVTLPIQLYFFYQFSLWGLVANLFVLPLLSILIFFTILSFLLPVSWSSIFVWVNCGILQLFKAVCMLGEKVPFHIWNPGFPGKTRMVFYYFVFFGVLVYLWKKRKHGNKIKRQRIALVVSFLAVFLVFGFRTNSKFTLRLVDVGQGDCIYIETGQGQHYLFDCGSSSKTKVAQNVLVPYLQYYGVKRLDGVFISHGDKDHISGILELLEGESAIEMKQIVIPDIHNKEEFSELLELAAKRKVRVQTVSQGDSLQWNNLSMSCVYPKKDCPQTENEASACFLWKVGEWRILLTGDLEGVGEEELEKLLGEKNITVDVLKVAHHGSAYSTKETFLNVLQPSVSLISVGQKNSYGHPSEDTLQRLEDSGSEIYMTKDSGEISLKFTGEGIKVQEYRKVEKGFRSNIGGND